MRLEPKKHRIFFVSFRIEEGRRQSDHGQLKSSYSGVPFKESKAAAILTGDTSDEVSDVNIVEDKNSKYFFRCAGAWWLVES